MLVFLGVSSALLGAIHYYLWIRLIRDTALPAPWRAIATAVLLVLALTVPLSLAMTRSYRPGESRLLYFVGYGWMGFMFLLLVGNALGELVKLASWAMSHDAAPDAERRTVLARFVGAGVALVGAGVGTLGTLAAYRPELKRITVPLAKLPAAMSGLKIVQLSDIHIGPTIGKEHLARLVATVNALNPDLVAITGDLVDGSVSALASQVAPLAELRAKHGVFFVTGNHEYYSGAAEWCAHLATLGIRVLRNERVAIDGIDLAGVDDFRADGLAEGHRHDPDRALEGRDKDRAVVLLAHQPKSMHDAIRHGVGLQLSGHTHGGQIFPWNFLVRLDQPLVDGLHRVADTWIYVSRGTGFWGPPMRVGAAAEVTEITLVSA